MGIVEMGGVLPYKLDTPALNAMIDEEDGDNESTNPLNRLKRLIQMETDDDIKQKLKATEAILRQAMKDLSEQDKKIVNNRLNDMEQVLAEVKGQSEDMTNGLKAFEQEVKRLNGDVENMSRIGPDLQKRLLMAEEGMSSFKSSQTQAMSHVHLELDELARKLESAVSAEEIESIKLQMKDAVQADGALSEEQTENIMKRMESDLQNKTSKTDVSRIIDSALQDVARQLRDELDTSGEDMWTLRAAAIPKTIAIGKLNYKVFRHGLPLGKSSRKVNSRLSSVSQTLAPAGPREKTVHPHEKKWATYPNGRTGALRPLAPQARPLVPIDDPLSGLQRGQY